MSAWVIQHIIMPSGLLMLTSGFAVLKELQKMAQARIQRGFFFVFLLLNVYFNAFPLNLLFNSKMMVSL